MGPRRAIAVVPAALCLIAWLGWSGCTERSGEEAAAKAKPAPPAAQITSHDAGSADDDDSMDRILTPFAVNTEWVVETGETDSRDRYSSAVEVLGNNQDGSEYCTGVLVSPRLVLTAASCLCFPRHAAPSEGGQQVVDGKACATAAAVEVTTHDPPSGDAESERPLEYGGPVRVHPAFKQVLDERGNVVSSEADLAIVVLNDPADVPPVELAESDVKAGESLVIVGYGNDPATDYAERRFSEHPVTKVLNPGGRVAFAQPSPSLYKGARGGPCLRQTGQGMRLVGILSASVGQEALFTSAHPYREWLRAQMRSAANAPVPARHVSP